MYCFTKVIISCFMCCLKKEVDFLKVSENGKTRTTATMGD